MNKHIQSGMTLIELTVVLLVLIALAGLAMPYIGGVSRKALCDATDLSMQNIKKAIMGGGSGAAFYLDTLGHFPGDKGAGNDYSLRYLLIRDDGLDNDGDLSIADSDDAWQPFDPETAVGWRGPYLMTGATLALESNLAANLTSAAGTYVHLAFIDGDSVVNDAWGRPIVLQVPSQAQCDTITGLTGTQTGYCARIVSAGSGDGLGIGDADIDTAIAGNRAFDDRILYLNAPTPALDINPGCDQ